MKIDDTPVNALDDYHKSIAKIKTKTKDTEDDTVPILVEIEYKKGKQWRTEKKVVEWKK